MLSLVRVLPGEVHVSGLEPGRAPFVFTRSEAIELHNQLSAALRVAEPFIPRLSLWRRATDWWRRRRMPKPSEAQLARARMLMGAGPTRTMVSRE